MQSSLVHFVVVGTVLVVVAALILKKPGCRSSFEPFVALKPSYDELVRRKVAVVRSMPSNKDPATVYFLVDSKGRLRKNPKLPYEGMNYKTVLQEVQDKFGPRAVEAVTTRRKSNKVQVVYDPKTQEVTKLSVPRQWFMPPRRLPLKSQPPLVVLLNPRAGSPVTSKSLVIMTGADKRVTSATVRG